MRIEKVNVNEEVFNTRDGFVVDVGYPDEVEPYWHIEVYNKEGKFIKKSKYFCIMSNVIQGFSGNFIHHHFQ